MPCIIRRIIKNTTEEENRTVAPQILRHVLSSEMLECECAFYVHVQVDEIGSWDMLNAKGVRGSPRGPWKEHRPGSHQHMAAEAQGACSMTLASY